ncbi:MAG TPA: TIGR02186 family protein [Aliidongia sp.]|nr:TIGR02186 family protein [Aliidongia sp.]
MRRLLLGLLLLLALAPRPASAQQLVADLTDHLVAITTGFNGANVTLFGSIDGGGDVVVVVRGPERETVVRRKSRIAGIWLNTKSMAFVNVPGYYRVFSNKPLDQVAPQSLRQFNQIGADQVKLAPTEGRIAHDEIGLFQSALLSDELESGLYRAEPGHIDFLGGKLFRATLNFPRTVPTGTYSIQIFLLRNGDVVAAQTTPLIISQTGLEATLNQFATDQPVLYGIIAVLMAAMAGWLASLLFRIA